MVWWYRNLGQSGFNISSVGALDPLRGIVENVADQIPELPKKKKLYMFQPVINLRSNTLCWIYSNSLRAFINDQVNGQRRYGIRVQEKGDGLERFQQPKWRPGLMMTRRLGLSEERHQEVAQEMERKHTPKRRWKMTNIFFLISDYLA